LSQNTTELNLFVAHRSALIDYASRITGNRAQAEDLVQEAWLRFNQASQGRFLDDAKGYLYRIVRNLAMDTRRRALRESRLIAADIFDQVAETHADEMPNPETFVLYQNEYQCVMKAMEGLPERTRIAFEMHRFGGAKLREIAEFLNISTSLAQVLVTEAAESCKDHLFRLRRSR
tara:strand:- start:418 stop:942 length:525 start_codon:yes stop_codon:yes gene_type:complete